MNWSWSHCRGNTVECTVRCVLNYKEIFTGVVFGIVIFKYNRKLLNFSQAVTVFQHCPAVRNVSITIAVLGEVSVAMDKKGIAFFFYSVLHAFQPEWNKNDGMETILSLLYTYLDN